MPVSPSLEPESAVKTLWEAFARQDWEGARQLLHDDFVCTFPQSRERFLSAEAYIGMNRAYPGNFGYDVHRILPCQGGAVSEVWIQPDEGPGVFAVSFFEGRAGKLSRAVEYWGEGFAAPEWRAVWSECY